MPTTIPTVNNGKAVYGAGSVLPTVGSAEYNLAQANPQALAALKISNPNLNISPDVIKPYITADALRGTVTPAVVPSPVMNNDALGSLGITAGKIAGDASTTPPPTTPLPTTPTTSTDNKSIKDYLKSIIGLQATKGDFTASQQTAQDVAGKTQAVNDINKQITLTTQAYDKQLKDAQNNNPTGMLASGQNIVLSDITRKKNEDLANLGILKSVALGDLNTANEIVKQKVDTKFSPMDDVLKSLQLYQQFNSNDLTESEQIQLQNQIATKKAERDQLSTAYANVLKTMAENNAPASAFKAVDAAASNPTGKPADIYAAAGQYGADLLSIAYKQAQVDKMRSETLANNNVNSPDAKVSLNNDVTAILEGRNTAYNIRMTMGRTNTASAYMQKLRDNITAIDPNFDFIASDAGGKSVSSAYVQRATAAINAVLPNIDHIVDLSNEVSRVGVKGVDSLLQKTKAQFGNKDVSSFHEAQKLIADEIGVALGAGTVSDMKLQLGFDVTDPSVSQEVFASNMGLVKDFIKNRLTGLQSLRYSSSVTGSNFGTVAPNINTATDFTATLDNIFK